MLNPFDLTYFKNFINSINSVFTTNSANGFN
ncbi:hypothetical protein C7447_103146 [Tenacibaculum adriaticum]|uniref:Uncharacterized protein n=1 Tax=Tenacibaculum adriaticum TaxID=413713 RepID=A0A5S5DTJ6_9FLAO|nr:hypothetical protein C7447_103146 [Tenacibaculum adriaticum]